MGIFSKAAAKAGSKVKPVVKRGAKDAREGKSGWAVNAFAQKGRDNKNSKG